MKDGSRRPGKRSHEEAEKTKADIIDAAAALFSANGYDITTLREIAAASGVSHGIIRHHFGSKLDIWKAVADRVLLHYREELLPILTEAAQDRHHLQSFKKVVRAFIDVSNRNPHFARLLVREGATKNERSDYFQGHFVQMHASIEKLFAKAKVNSVHLRHHTNDSFFLALISLTFFPLLMPELEQLLTSAQGPGQTDRAGFILNILLPQ